MEVRRIETRESGNSVGGVEGRETYPPRDSAAANLLNGGVRTRVSAMCERLAAIQAS